MLVVDDHALVRRGIRDFLDTQPGIAVVGEAATGAEALTLAARHHPDVVLMDLLMPEVDGVEATRRLAGSGAAVVVLTSHAGDEHVLPAVRAGALGYLLKDVDPEQLADGVRAAAAGRSVLHPQVAGRVLAELRGDRETPPSAFRDLTDREFEVLRLLGEGAANRDIADRLVISEKTVKTHVSSILAKLGLADRTQAAVLAWRTGVVRPDRP